MPKEKKDYLPFPIIKPLQINKQEIINNDSDDNDNDNDNDSLTYESILSKKESFKYESIPSILTDENENRKNKKGKLNFFLIMLIFLILLLLFQVGIQISIFNISEVLVYPNHSKFLWGLTVAAMASGAFTGCLINTFISNLYGRRTILLNCIFILFLSKYYFNFYL